LFLQELRRPVAYASFVPAPGDCLLKKSLVVLIGRNGDSYLKWRLTVDANYDGLTQLPAFKRIRKFLTPVARADVDDVAILVARAVRALLL